MARIQSRNSAKGRAVEIWQLTLVERLKTAHRASLAELDAPYTTLQRRVFRSER
jgi:hypothetical protein